MARAASLKVGDSVDFCGKTCKVIKVSNDSEVIAVQYGEAKGFISYIYARDCKKVV